MWRKLTSYRIGTFKTEEAAIIVIIRTIEQGRSNVARPKSLMVKGKEHKKSVSGEVGLFGSEIKNILKMFTHQGGGDVF